MDADNTWKALGPLAVRLAARLVAQREGKIFAGDAERPADEWGAATGRYAPAAAGERVNLGEEEGTAARQSGSAGGSCTLDLLGMNQASYCCSTAREIEIAGSREARTAETAAGRPTPLSAVSADHFAPPSSAATTALNFARQSASCS